MLLVPPKKHVTSSIDQLLKSESLSGENKWFCPKCSSNQDSCKETCIINCGRILILHLSRYSNLSGNLAKDTSLINSLPVSNHVLKVYKDDVSFSSEYSLVASINHSGTMNAGHYWAFIKDKLAGVWLKCNDRSVVEVSPCSLNICTSYVLFYERK